MNISPITLTQTNSILWALDPFPCLGLCLHRSKLIGIADGLDYLHSRDVTHGDLGGVRNCLRAHIGAVLTSKQPNIIVSDSGRPIITGYGSTSAPPPHPQTTEVGCCDRWAEPKRIWCYLLATDERDKKSDIFSFAMVTVEVTLRHWTRHNSWLMCSPPNVGLHRTSAVLRQIRFWGNVGYNRWTAPGTTDPYVSHRRAVGIDGTMLGCGPWQAP